MELILKYFPELSEKQTEQFRQLDAVSYTHLTLPTKLEV